MNKTNKKNSISGNIIDIFNETIYSGTIHVEDGTIKRIEKQIGTAYKQYILPGFTDAHVHIESSMLLPTEFARLAVVHGSVGSVSDPHEIGNVLGVDGIRYMLENAKKSPFKFCFGAPSCVPATIFETAGASISVSDLETLIVKDKISYLAEMMNWPGVLSGDAEVLAKINIAKKYNIPVDGHAPGLKGKEAEKYIKAGISTDHECFTEEEALDKLKHGMKILIREGSAAKNFDALIGLLDRHADSIMFCSDDKHPDNLVEGHINLLVKRALAKGHNLFKILKVACVNPVLHYRLSIGLLRQNDPADFIIIDDVKNFAVLKTFINGDLVAENGKTKLDSVSERIVNRFCCSNIFAKDLALIPNGKYVNVIEVLDGQLITNALKFPIEDLQDKSKDILKLVVVNRYENKTPVITYIKNFRLKSGAIASSVAHDSHNIIAVGTEDESISRSINLIIKNKGGISAVNHNEEKILPLPVAGLMSTEDGYEVAKNYTALDKMAKLMGSTLKSPYMSLSFMALLVIPCLKLSDKGLFDGKALRFKELFEG